MKSRLRSFVSTFIIAALAFISCASASFHHGSPGGVFNGGKFQLQSSFLGISGDYPFLNLVKTMDQWKMDAGAGPADPSAFLFNSDGYPTALPSVLSSGSLHIPPQASRAGNYKITWTGSASIIVQVLSSGSISTISGSNGTSGYTFLPSADVTQLVLKITSLTTTPGDLRLFHVNDETDLNNGKILGARYLALLQQGRPGVLRFLDWTEANNSGATSFATRKPTTFYSYAATEFRTSLFVGSTTAVTTASGIDYSISGNGTGVPASGGPTNKETFHLKFATGAVVTSSTVTFTAGVADIAWTATPLAVGDIVGFDVSGSGATMPNSILYGKNYYVVSKAANTFQVSATSGGAAIVTDFGGIGTVTVNRMPTLNLNTTRKIPARSAFATFLAAGDIFTNQFVTAIYDSTLDSYLIQGSGNPSDSTGIKAGIPIEVLISICATVGSQPHIPTPYLALDTDWLTQEATYIKNNGPSWMVPRFEGPNETWNFGFPATTYALAVGGAQWGDKKTFHNWYGWALSQIAAQVGAVYGTANKGVAYNIMAGVPSSTFASASASDQRLKNNRQLGSQFVNISNPGGVVTLMAGGTHGKSIGDPVSFNTSGSSTPTGITADQRYYVASTGFSTTAFNITSTVGGGGSIITVSSAGNGDFYLYDASLLEAYNSAPIIQYTTYWAADTYTQLAEGVSAMNYAVGTAGALDDYAGNNYITASTSSAASITSNVLTIGGATTGVWAVNEEVIGPGIPAGVTITSNGTGTGGAGTYNVTSTSNVAGPIAVKGDAMLPPIRAWAAWGLTMPVPVTRHGSYEGSYGPDIYGTGTFAWSPVTSATKGVTSVMAIPTTDYITNQTVSGNMAVVGAGVVLGDFAGTFAPFNGKLYTITAVSGANATINLDSSGVAGNDTSGSFGYMGPPTAFTGTIAGSVLTVSSPTGAALKVGASLFYSGITFPPHTNESTVKISSFGTGTGGAGTYNLNTLPGDVTSIAMQAALGNNEVINNLLLDVRDSPTIQASTLQLFNDVLSVSGGQMPSLYYISGASQWGTWHPDIYAPVTPPIWSGILQFNFLLKRDIDPAGNDNDPMWLEKAA